MNLMGLKSARNDRVAEVLLGILVGWVGEYPSTWIRHLEIAYHRANKTGTIIGIFSNLAGKLGKPIQEQPFFQVEAMRWPLKKSKVSSNASGDYGLSQYLGDELDQLRVMLFPFMVYAEALGVAHEFRQIVVGDWRKGEPLVVSFKNGKTLMRLTVFGHVLINDAKLINESVAPHTTASTPEEMLFAWGNLVEEQLVEKLAANRIGFPVYRWGAGDSSTPVGTYSNPRMENGSIAVDIRFIRPYDYPHGAILHIGSSLGRDPRRSQGKYRRRQITEHTEYQVCVTGAPPK